MSGDLFWQLEKADSPINGIDTIVLITACFLYISSIKVTHLSLEINFESSMYPR